MKNVLIIIALLLVLTGCAPTDFYNNRPADVFSASQFVSIRLVSEKNSVFTVYKINSEQYAIRSGFKKASEHSLQLINDAIIFSEEDVEKLKKTCIDIINNYDNVPNNETNIIEYHLVLKKTQLQGSSSTFVYANIASTETQVSEYQRVVFRLQFLRESSDVMMAGKSITYMFKDYADAVKLDDIKTLLNDLRK